MSDKLPLNGNGNGNGNGKAEGVPVDISLSSLRQKNGFLKLWDTNAFVGMFSLAIMFLAGGGFIFKLVEFARSIDMKNDMVFAIMPIVTYLIVASGFMCLFIWAFVTGKFADLEAAKYAMLEQEERYERAEKSIEHKS